MPKGHIHVFLFIRKFPHLWKAFEIGHRWRWGPHFLRGRIRCYVWQCGRRWWRCLREEWNHLCSNNKKGRREISYYSRIVCTQSCYIVANTWALRGEKADFPGTKERHPLCSNAFRAVRSKFSWSFMFFPPSSLRFSFLLLDIRHTDRRGKYSFFHLTLRGEVAWNSLACHSHLIFKKFFFFWECVV